MKRAVGVMLCLLLMLSAQSAVLSEGEQMDVMETILSAKKQMPALSAFDDIALRARKELGVAVREIEYRWENGRFNAQVTFGSTLAPVTPLKDTAGRFTAVTEGAEYPYLLYLPEHYDESRQYPTILFLHGIGERGDDPTAVAAYGPFQYILSGAQLDAIIIAPQVEQTAHWVEDENENETDVQMKRLAVFVEQMKNAYPVDDDRLYLTGLSMGGRGAYKLACYLPNAFAAVAICCGRAGEGERPEHIVYDLSKMADKPVWIFHGLSDGTVNPEHALKSVERLLALNEKGDYRLTLYPAVGHGCYEHAYLNAALYQWMLACEREKTE